MRFARPLMVALALLTGLIAATASSADLTHRVEFPASLVTTDTRDALDVIQVEGCRFELQPGKPMIPVRSIHFSIPADMRAVGVEVISRDQIEIGRDFYLAPAQPPVRLDTQVIPEFVPPDPAVYESSLAYPGKISELVGTGNIGGYRVAAVTIYPLEYRPLDGRVFLNRSIELRLILESSEDLPKVIRGRTEAGERAIADRVRALVANPGDVDGNIGPRATGDRQGIVEYAIVTGSSYTDEFQVLADWKTKKGVPAEVFTTGWIYSTYSGYRDNQESIREFVKDYEANHGLVYVLLAGDVDVVPARIAWDDLGYDEIRADLYFSDTDGNWNADGDSRWGEHPADNVDMYGDVYVGRASVNTSAEATNFVDQTLTYEGAAAGDPLPTDFQLDLLFMAENLWSDPYTDNCITKQWIDDDYVPSRFDINLLCESLGSLNYTSAMSGMNDGPNITNHIGHSNYGVMSIGPDALYNEDMDALVNGTRQGIYYTIGCWAAAFDYDNIAEHYVNNPNGGGVAFVGNSRYGWGCPGYPGECVSELYDRQFFRAMFTSDLYILGIAHADHKDYYVPDSKSDEYMRYGLYELNVLGDPELPLWMNTPSTLAVSYPSSLPTGSTTFDVQVNTGKAAVQNARVCLWKGDEVYLVGYTDGSGHVSFEPEPTTGGMMSVTVTKRDYLPYEGESEVLEGTPPSAPTGLAAEGADSEVSLSWDPNPEPDVDFYILFRDTSPNPSDSLVTIPAPDVAFLDADVVNDTTYYYRLKAVDLEGEKSGYSNQVSATPSKPPVIFIAHTPLEDTDDASNPYPVVATITTTEAPLLPDSILVVYESQMREWESVVMAETGTPNEYRGDIPAQPCGMLIDYYILAVDENHNRETDPDFAPGVYHSFSVNYTVVLEDDFEQDRGWTVGAPDDDATTGVWERCNPEGTEAQAEDDHTPGAGVNAYITQCEAGSSQGSYDIDDGKTTLFSPIFDLTGYTSATASYYRWYSNDTGSSAGEDFWVVDVTDDGGAHWYSLENTDQSARAWTLMQFDLGSYIALTDQVQFRFVASDEGSGSLVEAGVDDFRIAGCPEGGDVEPPVVTVFDPNGGEEIDGGSGAPYTIRWDSYDNVDVVMTHLLFSIDGGGSYPDTLVSADLDSSWDWDVPDMSCETCRIKIVCLDEAGNEGNDESDGDFTIFSLTDVELARDIPSELTLGQNRPNPFNPVTEIVFGITAPQHVRLEVYDVHGRLVTTLADGHYRAGYHSAVWRGTDARSREVSTGVYFYRLVSEEGTLTRKMLLLK